MHVEATTLGRLRRLELTPVRFFQLALLNVGMLWLIVVIVVYWFLNRP